MLGKGVLGDVSEGVGGAFFLAPDLAASVSGAHWRHLRVILLLLSKQPADWHWSTVEQRVMDPPHQLQKLTVVLI